MRKLLHPLPLIVIACALVAAGLAAVLGPRPAAVMTSELIRQKSAWSFFRSGVPPEPSWRTDTVGWPQGTAPFGFGVDTGPLTTTLPSLAEGQPLSTYFRAIFDLGDTLPASAQITTWADDGIVVHVNGKEVGRANVATAAEVSDRSFATSAPSSMAARSTPITFAVPLSVLRAGTNVLAVQVLSNWRETQNITFDANLTITRPTVPGEPGATEPTRPDRIRDDGVLPGWGVPTWRDEFTYREPRSGAPAVDPAKWNVRGRDDLGLLTDAAVVDREQVSVDSSGVLHIKADWLDSPVIRPPDQDGPRELWHHTGYLDHRVLEPGDMSQEQRYGRWEIRAKVPTGPQTYGSLAAFWLRNRQSGEIDIMEAWGYDDAGLRDQRIGSATTTVHTHTDTPEDNRKYTWHHSDHDGPVQVWRSFHTYAFELTPTYAAVYVDGAQLKRVTPDSHPRLWDRRYFDTPLHVRLNLHVGSSELYWGLPDPEHREATQELDFQVDYVRMWSYPAAATVGPAVGFS